MAKQKVSHDFMKFQAKNQNHLADAAKAENNMTRNPLEVGTKGIVTVVDLVAAQSKKGNPYVNMTLVVAAGPHEGTKLIKNWSFNDTAKATAIDRFGWFLNELENMGFPRTLRESSGGDVNVIIDYYLEANPPIQLAFEIMEDNYAMDKKKTVLYPADTVTPSQEEGPIKSIEELKVGVQVLRNGVSYEVIKYDDDKETVNLRSLSTNKVRENVALTELEFSQA
jgi:hypothetical protein